MRLSYLAFHHMLESQDKTKDNIYNIILDKKKINFIKKNDTCEY